MSLPVGSLRSGRGALVWAAAACGAVVVAALVTDAIPLSSRLHLPAPIILIGLIWVIAAPFLVTEWRATFWILLAWLLVEDLIRKYLGNDIRVYFMKDALYLILLVGMVVDPRVSGAWKRAAGAARSWLYAIIAWSVVLSVPMVFVDWRIPLIALKLDWQYVPLVVAGFLLATEEGGVRRLLTGFVALGIPTCLIGIIQAQIGPDFLRPAVVTQTSHLLRLDLVRTHDVFQPTGTFVDAGRFGAMAMLTYVSSLALLILNHRTAKIWARPFAIAGVVIGAGAVWAHAGKTGVLVAAATTIIAAFAPAFADRRLALGRALLALSVAWGALMLMFMLFPQLSASRVAYLSERLDPRASTNEWGSRITSWRLAAMKGVAIGGVLGAGTGAGSLGLEYLSGETSQGAVTGVEEVEGGYASVEQQWGIVGLALWLGWSVAWTRRLWRHVERVRGTPLAGVGLIVVFWVVLFLFVGFVQGFQGFQDYYANAYFWILSGMVFAFPTITGARDGA